MRKNNIQELEIFQIFAHADIQPRVEIHQETVNEYVEEMRQGAKFPPVVVFREDDVFYWLADGFHRFEAAKEAGRTFIQAEIRAGGKREAILYAVGANAIHGLRRSNIDKRNSVLKLLKDEQWSQWSDREIARRCQVSPDTVNRIRRSLSESDSENETRSYRTKHGTVATMNTRNIGMQRQIDEELEGIHRELRAAIMSGEVDPADIPVRFETTAGSPRNEQTNSVEHLVSLYQALSYEEKQSFLETLNLAEKPPDPGDEQQSIIAWVCKKNGLTEDELHEKIRWFYEGPYEKEELAEEFGITTEQVIQLEENLSDSEPPWSQVEVMAQGTPEI
ncbi:MAG: ParB N-terminal domain-containing protein [Syntrophobacteria bacterium]